MNNESFVRFVLWVLDSPAKCIETLCYLGAAWFLLDLIGGGR